MKKVTSAALLLILIISLASCDKGYDVRITNYSTETMDTVTVGNKTLLFTDVARQTQTSYFHLKKGSYGITCVSKSRKRYTSSITIDKKGSGKRSIQIDGTGAIVVLED